MKLKRIILSVLCMLFLTIVSIFQTATYADTTSSCTSGQYNCFDGFEKDFLGPGLTSVYANIYTPSYPANYSQSATDTWVMISNDSSTNQYVQVGWIESNNETGRNGTQTISISNGVHYFYEINYGDTCSSCDFQTYNTYGPAQNSTHAYRVALTNGNWVGTEDNAQIGSEPSQSYASFPSGEYATYSEELTSDQGLAYNSAFAGTNASRAKFSSVRAYFNGTTYYSPSPSTYYSDVDAMSNFNNYDSTKSDQTQSYIEFWDQRY